MKGIVNTLILLITFGWAGFLFAQEAPADFPPSEFHRDRREALRSKLPQHSVAVIFANPVRNRSNDIDYRYHQDPDFYYLTGLREPHAVLIIFKDWQQSASGERFNELVFVQKRDPLAEMWNGPRLGPDGVKEAFGFEQVFESEDFLNLEIDWSGFDFVLFDPFFNDIRNTDRKGDLYDLTRHFKAQLGYPAEGNDLAVEPKLTHINTTRLDEIMGELRVIKQPVELALLRKAIQISVMGQIEVMKALRPGMSETEVQGIHEFVFKKYGAEAEGYPSIVGSGHNGCILHYIDNHKVSIEPEDLILMDLGAEYRGYTADVTRTLPIDGTFSKEQEAIYNIVLQAQEAAFELAKPGTLFEAISEAARDKISEGLVQLGIIEDSYESYQYYPHGLTHHIGLDVHDKGPMDVLRENMVITIEPGIYIPENSPCDEKWWGIAVRIEDDILITGDGYENLSREAPRSVEDVEAMMQQPSALDEFVLPRID